MGMLLSPNKTLYRPVFNLNYHWHPKVTMFSDRIFRCACTFFNKSNSCYRLLLICICYGVLIYDKHGLKDNGHVEYDQSVPGMGPSHTYVATGLKKGNQMMTGIQSMEKCPYSECGAKSNKGTYEATLSLHLIN